MTNSITAAEKEPPRAPYWVTLKGKLVDLRAIEAKISKDRRFTIAYLAKEFGVTRQALYQLLRKYGVKRGEKTLSHSILFDGEKFYRDNSTGYYRSTRKPHRMLQQVAYEKYFGQIPQDCTVHFKDGNKSNSQPDNLIAIRRNVKHDRCGLAMQRRNIRPGYVTAADGRVYLKVRDECEYGFSIMDECDTWPGGVGLPRPIVQIPDDDWSITDAVRRRLGYILEGAREMYQEPGGVKS